MKTGTLILWLCAFSLSNWFCAGFNPELLRPKEPIEQRIPALEVLIDERSLESAFSLGRTKGEGLGYTTGLLGGLVSVATLRSQGFRDKRIQDAVVIFDREVSNNICEPEGEKYGYVICRIANRDASTGWGWFVVSALTAFTINLFGFPAASQSAELDVEVEIQDSKHNRIGRYSAVVKNTRYAAFYWGYSGIGSLNADRDTEISRVVNAEALRKALQEIKSQINREAMKIRMRLTEAGKLQD